MKKLNLFLIVAFSSICVFLPRQTGAQVPQKMSYQAVIRNSSNALITSTTVGIRISILQGSSTGKSVYIETQTSSTNENGLVSLEIGSGTIVSGIFQDIDWAGGPYFIKTETDREGGSNYSIVGSSQLLSVPYAFFSGNKVNNSGNIWLTSGNNIYNMNSGNVGIGTNKPLAPLNIKHDNEALRIQGVSTYISFYNNKDTKPRGFIQNTDDNLYLGTSTGNTNGLTQIYTNGTPLMTMTPTGQVGIGLVDPSYTLDIADRIRIRSGPDGSGAGIWLNDLNNTAPIAFMGTKDVDAAGIYGNNSGWGLLMNTNTGNIAIGDQNTGGDFKLNVNGAIAIASGLRNPNDGKLISLYAFGDLWCNDVYKFSDARIKDIIGISNSSLDLETINSFQITDYTMKDKLSYRNTPFKKVIAQEVEKVYPQVVSKSVGYIPNVYAAPNKIEKIAKGYLLSFVNKHNLSKEAKKIQLIIGDKTNQFDIVSIPAANQVVINAVDLVTDNVFVYGEQVNDIRAIDYDGLSMLNISATQELSKIISKQQKVIEDQQKQLEQVVERLSALEGKH